MPIYEYKCAECGTTFEKFVQVSGGEVPPCSACGSGNVKKLFSSFGFASSGKTSLSGGCTSCSSTNCSTCGMGG